MERFRARGRAVALAVVGVREGEVALRDAEAVADGVEVGARRASRLHHDAAFCELARIEIGGQLRQRQPHLVRAFRHVGEDVVPVGTGDGGAAVIQAYGDGHGRPIERPG